jgi:uncharacterized protein YaiI (UPF0178 family)
MRIFIDADACPRLIKEIIYKAAQRTKTEIILVANSFLQVPFSPLIKTIIVGSGFNEADKRIANELNSGDLVITADIPLANIIVNKGGTALNPRGIIYTAENIKHKLATRNLMEQLRDNQMVFGGPPTFNKFDCQAFANQLDKILSTNRR